MRILLVAPRVKGIGGIGRYVRELCMHLIKRGHEVDVISCDYLPHIKVKMLANPSFAVSSIVASIVKRLSNKYDVVHAHHIFAYPSAKTCSPRVVLTLHGDFQEQIKFMYGKKFGAIASFLEKTAVSGSRVVTAISPYIANVYMSRYDINVVYTPNAIDPRRIPKSEIRVTEKVQIAFVGRLSKEKGIITLLNAIRNINKKSVGEEACFVIAGSGPLSHYVKKVCEKISNIRYLGELKHHDALKLIKGSDILILPSYKEGFPTVILEAMLLGTLVVASDIPEVKSIVLPSTAVLFKTGDSESLASAIMSIISNKEAYRKVTENARKLVLEKYVWSKVVNVIENIYNKAIE